MNTYLYKSDKNKVIDGVCGGIAEYFGFDVTVLRILFVICFGFTGWVYLALMLLMPKR